ncbi:hypothetical protein [Rhodopirellula sp. P2]|uniref:hypothetical protein n=1 Tax=Rhodopirellula sp. P2 TaxID=2127060 RepID=UPI002368E7C2|nr:hypothetical protein [Rhodopirellula sp. P2]WDQ18498.1 hypothetical protein PSR62_08145 [Rhodopirellula sp. P2]
MATILRALATPSLLGNPVRVNSQSDRTTQVTQTFMNRLAALSVVWGVFLASGAVAQSPVDAPRMMFADDVSGKPMSKDPAVVKFKGKYWLYYSIPPFDRKSTTGWTIGVATSGNLVDWEKAAELQNTGAAGPTHTNGLVF